MNLDSLIEMLTDYRDELGGDAEVRLMTQQQSEQPLNTKEMIEAMQARGYWASPGGKTPHATLYSAILRDLSAGDDSKFVKTERGRFAART